MLCTYGIQWFERQELSRFIKQIHFAFTRFQDGVPDVLRCALARRLSIQMRFRCAQMSSRSTHVNPNEFPKGLNALSLDACQSKCVSCVLGFTFARRLSIQMRLLCGQMRSRSTLVDPNAFLTSSDALSLDACRSKCVSDVLRTGQVNLAPEVLPSGLPMLPGYLSSGVQSRAPLDK